MVELGSPANTALQQSSLLNTSDATQRIGAIYADHVVQMMPANILGGCQF